ncbi:hypothetical protein KC614_04470 [candidate division WWE3 bacterium]|uniref:Uncharacterized protein n=1 Tax=candidate division WWE3 bacterium TaxID=2053526 RepID=A0A955LLG0_UNCKA|nr:hypothetical protein [candidate division WWE3 bacterium]
MAKISVPHPSLGPAKTSLKQDYASGSSTINLLNTSDFSANDFIVMGKIGSEGAEIRQITSVGDIDTVTLTAATQFDHYKDLPVQEIPYDQVKIYTATSETGTYSLLATVSIAIDQDVTEYDHSAGTSSTWYKFTYYNSDSTAASGYSAAVAGTGYTQDSLASMQEEVLEELGDRGSRYITKNQLRRYARRAVTKIARRVSMLHGPYLQTNTTQSLTSGTATYSYPTRFMRWRKIEISFDGSSVKYKVRRFVDEGSGSPDTVYYQSEPRIYSSGTTFGIRPTPDNSSGVAYLWFDQYPAVMTDPDDEHGLPYGAREVIVDYMLAMAWANIDRDRAKAYMSDYRSDLEEYLVTISEGVNSYQPAQFNTSDPDDYTINDLVFNDL